MGYTAFTKMQEINKKEWGKEAPHEPKQFETARIWEKGENGERKSRPTFFKISQLEEKAISFIRNDCEGLRFKRGPKYENLDDYEGASLRPGQIPYNFQMDNDRRCLEVAIHRFLESGMAKDAFDVYFCYLEMFIGSYKKTKKMIEMLSEFETNASSLLMKHRDHYSHSVYVFLIGLAFFHESKCFRDAYRGAYKELMKKVGLNPDKKHDLAAHFLQYWGLTALFHDIGYPFELSFEQVKSYFGDTIDYVPYVSFNMHNFQNSKMGEIAFKAKELKKDLSVSFEELSRDSKKDTYPSEEELDMLKKEEKEEPKKLKDLKKIEKKIASFMTDVYGDKADWCLEEYGELLCLVNKKQRDTEKNLYHKAAGDRIWHEETDSLSSRYRKAIDCLEKFITDVNAKKNKDIDNLKKMTSGEIKFEKVENLNAFLAHALYEVLGEDYAYYIGNPTRKFDGFEKFSKRKEYRYSYDYEDYLYDVLQMKPEHPEQFNGYIDHAYFSSVMLLSTLLRVMEDEHKELNEMHTQALTAILLHNSLYKFSVTNYNDNDPKEGFNTGKHFNLDRHPLAYLLMLCDELQCWDRFSYGQNSRGEVHAFDCELKFKGDTISATYFFDEDKYKDNKTGQLKDEFKKKKGTYNKLFDKPKDLKDVKDKEKSRFLADIEHIISINGDNSFEEKNKIKNEIKLEVWRDFKKDPRFRNASLSTSNFIHLYKFAVLVHQMNHENDKSKKTDYEKEFEEMSLEYKINHISRAKKFSKALEKIGCFYSDKPMDYEIVTDFSEKELTEKMGLGPIEHERWCWEHFVMGWRYISKKDLEDLTVRFSKDSYHIRECLKLHPDLFEIKTKGSQKGTYENYDKEEGLTHFNELDSAHGHNNDSKEKDIRGYQNLLTALAQEDGVKVYRLTGMQRRETEA